MARAKDPSKRPHLRLLPPINGQPISPNPTSSLPIFVPGRTYRNWKMSAVDFLVDKIDFHQQVASLTGTWIYRVSKKPFSKKMTRIRINIPEDWKLLPLNTHPRRKIEILEPWEKPYEDPDCPPDDEEDEDDGPEAG